MHVVRGGDSVSRIAARHGVARSALVSANSLADPAALRAGQRLKLPGCRPPSAVQTAEASPAAGSARPAPPPGAEPASWTHDSLVARVGPRRVPTRLHIGVPEFGGDVEFLWPVDGPVLSGFGRRRGGWHAGVDIRAERGTPIRPAAPGIVSFSGWETFYGKVVKIEHANGFVTLYAHNLENLVQAGDQVDSDTVIATVGRTGRATGDHVHFEIRRGGMAYNPVHLLESREAPTLVASPYSPPEPDQIPVSSLAMSPDDFEVP